MNDEILEKYISQHIKATTENLIFFSWHGGEPLLAGIDFYRKVIRIQSIYKPDGKTIVNGIQTNGTLLNEAWCNFLAKENFRVGISIDGPEGLHDAFRKYSSGKGTFQTVLRGYELLQSTGIIPEILCVVNSLNVMYPSEVYELFRNLKPQYITFLPLALPGEDQLNDGVASVPPKEFGLFLSAIFDDWLEKDIGKIKIQIFEETLRTAFKQEHTLCIFKKDCGGVPVIEHNGDFYSCDHFVNQKNYFGNIQDHSVSYYLDSERQMSFGKAKSQSLPQFCLNCEVLSMCNGECPKNRTAYTPDGEYGLNYLCEGYKYFFNHCRPFVEAVAKLSSQS